MRRTADNTRFVHKYLLVTGRRRRRSDTVRHGAAIGNRRDKINSEITTSHRLLPRILPEIVSRLCLNAINLILKGTNR
jgi:hypothetical protein